MGPVITVNSATLVNKGLEVIEAHLLYDIPFDRIEVVVHPQSVRPLDGGVHRRLDSRPGEPARHAAARSRWAWAGPSGCRTRRRPSTGRKASTWEFFPLDTEAFPVGRPRPPGGAARAARPRPSSTPRTRSAWRRSRADGCRSPASWIRSPLWSRNTATPPGNVALTRRGRPRSGDLGACPGP